MHRCVSRTIALGGAKRLRRIVAWAVGLDKPAAQRYFNGMIDPMTSAYVGGQQAQVQQDAGMAVLKSSVDLAARQGSEMVGLIASAGAASSGATDAQVQQGLAMTDPAVGQNIDLFV